MQLCIESLACFWLYWDIIPSVDYVAASFVDVGTYPKLGSFWRIIALVSVDDSDARAADVGGVRDNSTAVSEHA